MKNTQTQTIQFVTASGINTSIKTTEKKPGWFETIGRVNGHFFCSASSKDRADTIKQVKKDLLEGGYSPVKQLAPTMSAIGSFPEVLEQQNKAA